MAASSARLNILICDMLSLTGHFTSRIHQIEHTAYYKDS